MSPRRQQQRQRWFKQLETLSSPVLSPLVCLPVCPPSGPGQHWPPQRVWTEDKSDGPAAHGGHFLHDGQHLHHHVRTRHTDGSGL